MKHLLIVNSGRRGPSAHSQKGEYKVTFMEVHASEDVYRAMGLAFDDIVWARHMPWDHPDREYVESYLNSRMVNRNDQ